MNLLLLASVVAVGAVVRAQFTFAPPPPPPTPVDLTDATCALVNAYRTTDGKRPLAPSRTMATVALEHARNLVLYYDWADVQRCNPHSWLDDLDDPERQTWSACCYPLEDCTGPAPRYISSAWPERYHYKGFARENVFWTSGARTPQGAFDAWRNSQGHNATMVWANARTCGAAGAGGFLLLWLGSADDPVPYVSGGAPPERTVPPTQPPSLPPTRRPTLAPTLPPTDTPTRRPSASPSKSPTARPSRAPSTAPTRYPTRSPTPSPTRRPTATPTRAPTAAPSFTAAPTARPMAAPTARPTSSPTAQPIDRNEISRSGALAVAALVLAAFTCTCVAINCCVPKRTVRKRAVRAARALIQPHDADDQIPLQPVAARSAPPTTTMVDLFAELECWEQRRQRYEAPHINLSPAERRRLLAEADVAYERLTHV